MAITEREEGEQHPDVTRNPGDPRGITIQAAERRASQASITALRIVSDQVNMTQTQSGQVLAGTDAVTEITDLWTFERDLAQPGPIWHLVAARSA